MNKTTILFFVLMAIFMTPAMSFAQDKNAPENKEAAYTTMLDQRCGKIVQGLDLKDAAKAEKIKAIVVQQYRDLNTIYVTRDSALKVIKAGTDKTVIATQTEQLQKETDSKLELLHKTYFAKLSKQLTPEQVDKVKDGMTYNVLNITYKAYQDEIPTLTEKQKKQIYDWLAEAREHAVDAESSEKKHAWFGKYKGRIGNYLSKEGYDMKKENEGWMARIKAKQAADSTKKN